MVNGLAKRGTACAMVLRTKHVDASLFRAKSGYSPMTEIILADAHRRFNSHPLAHLIASTPLGGIQRLVCQLEP